MEETGKQVDQIIEDAITTSNEPTVKFKLISDRSQMLIKNEETKTTLVEISGYDLQFNINMEYINSLEDVETAIGGLGQMFRQVILDKLLEYKKQSDET